jgi:hypothetical protein
MDARLRIVVVDRGGFDEAEQWHVESPTRPAQLRS